MKKFAGIMAALLLVTMLGGCYKSDTVLQFKANGDVEVTSTFLATQEVYSMASMTGPADILSQYSEESLEAYMTANGIRETGERLELSVVDAEGNIVEATPAPSEVPTPAPEAEPTEEASPETTEMPEATEPTDADTEAPAPEEAQAEAPAEEATETPAAEDGTMTGTRLRMRFDNLDDAKESFTLGNYMNTFGTMALVRDEAQGFGLDIKEKQTMLGTKYTVSGNVSAYGMVAPTGEGVSEEMKEQAAGASNSITFKFPLLSLTKSSGTTDKNFLGNTMTWTATTDAPLKDVYLEVTVINPLILVMALIILILVIILIIVTRKKRKDDETDTYFMDEDGNLIPVYDEEEEVSDEFEEAFFDDTTLEDGEQSANAQYTEDEAVEEEASEPVEEIGDDAVVTEDDAAEDKE